MNMLMQLHRPFLYTRHGLRSAPEWRLIRHLAGEVCRQMQWSLELQYPDFEDLWIELGDEVLDDDIERARYWFREYGKWT